MSTTKEIRSKIDSVQNIRKIAKAMEMIAASKMYKTKKNMLNSKAYFDAICKVITHISLGQSEYKHFYFVKRKVKSIGYLIISSDRGLAGSLNINLFRKLILDIDKWYEKKVTIKLSIIGSKAITFFRFMKEKIVSCMSGVNDTPKMSDLIGSIKIMCQLYDSKEIDRLYIANNRFVNTMLQVPQIFQILPIMFLGQKKLTNNSYWDYLYEPDSKMLLNVLLQRYIETQVYQGVIENLVSEHASRMVAMKVASDNGEMIINDLKLFYNKIRQNKITQELIEIVSGASVV